MMATQEPVRMGIIGGGLFARDAHLPALQELGDAVFKVVAICSRTEQSAAARAAQLDYDVDVLTDMDALLARDDINAVNLILPIGLMPAVTQKALASGKHIISEKPVSPTVAAGRELLQNYSGEQVWMVAENFRYHDTFTKAGELIQAGTIGNPLLATWVNHIQFTASKYYQTNWRRDGSFVGGLFLDGGVHMMAALRMVLGEIKQVSAFAAAERDDLPGVSTVTTNLRFDSGLIANYSVTFSAPGEGWGTPLIICGDKGQMEVDFDKIKVQTGNQTTTLRIDKINNVRNELAAFAAAIRDGTPHRNSPEQAIQDVAIVEAAMRSAETGQAVEPERVV
jgi:predicted dehydrogenase